MKTATKLLLVGAVAFSLGVFSNNLAFSQNNGLKIGVVDVQKVVQGYSKVNKLKAEEKAKIDDLKKFVVDAKSQVAKEPDSEKKKTLEEGFNKELNIRKNAIDQDYAQKLEVINKDITTIVTTVAKTKQINIVLTKTSVLYGGNDITAEITKQLK
jgi:outer membrane protein